MLAFVGVFTIAWIWPALAMTWDFLSPGTLPIGLHYMDVGAISGSGFFNFLVWISHPAYRAMVCQKEEQYENQMSLDETKDDTKDSVA